ncbi:glycolate oxidase subunit GlcE [bacterium]|nr:glycolate oxidase subunit GlcE [bacterium]
MTLSTPIISVSSLDEVKSAVTDAVADESRLEIIASGSKRALGRQCVYDVTLDLSAMTGIIDYQPEELVLTVRAGTPMAEVQAALAEARQTLAFEVPDYSHLLDTANAGTIGGVVATNLSGPRRLTAGAARDYLLGFEAISGRGEAFKSGGKVMKNVTGYDLSKLMTGSFGTLAVMDEITLKTLPRPETSCSLIVQVDDFAAAASKIASLFATPHEPGSAAILPAELARQAGLHLDKDKVKDRASCVIVVRLEGIDISIADRLANLQRLTGGDRLEATDSEALWAKIRDVRLFSAPVRDVWKISCPPAAAASVIDTIKASNDISYFADWAGGLIWMTGGTDTLGADLRQALAGFGGGFAMLVRDSGTTRQVIPPFQPLSGPMLALHKRVKAAFDPLAVLNAGRMHDGI